MTSCVSVARSVWTWSAVTALRMFALMAEYEAALIRERTAAGLAAARARGATEGANPR